MRNSSSIPIARSLAVLGFLIASMLTAPVANAVSIAAPAAPKLAITSVEVNQALGRSSDKFAAGKDAVIRVYLDGPVTVDPGMQNVVVQVGGNTLTTLQPEPSTDPTDKLTFVCPTRSVCNDWKAGQYTFMATVNGVTGQTTATFQDRRPLRVLAVPIKAYYTGGEIKTTTGAWKQGGDFMRQVYPVAPAGYQWILGQELDLSTEKYNVDTDSGQRQVWEALSNLQPNECSANKTAANCYDLIVGFVADRLAGSNGQRTLQGFTYGTPANIVVEADQDMPATVAHEVGHTFGLGDEYDGGSVYACSINPPPPTYRGQDGSSCPSSTAMPPPEGTGVLIPASTDHPYEVGKRGQLPDMAGFMGSGGKQSIYWVTSDEWKQIFDGMAPRAASAASAADIRLVNAQGFINRDDSVDLEPWHSFMESSPPAVITGTAYSIVAVDAGGTTLASQGLRVSFFAPDQPPLDASPFDVAVPFPANTAEFRIMKGTSVLKTVHVNPHSPVVGVTAPSAGQTVSGTTTIRWSGSHADGASLFYDVEYNQGDSPDNWITLATGITETQWVDDFNTLPGGSQARIRVTASDGVNSTEATSALFSVPAKPPEVFIDGPTQNAWYRSGEEIALDGSAYDLQDDWLAGDAQFTWSSNRDGMLGKGELLYVDNLSVGKHVLTLTATNSAGLSASQSVTVTITYPKTRFFPAAFRAR